MKNILLGTITTLALIAFVLSVCAMEITPVVVIMLFGSMAWLLPFAIVNRGCW